jgi:hypothetical protein
MRPPLGNHFASPPGTSNSFVNSTPVHVRRFDGLGNLHTLAPIIDFLNEGSGQWSPFHTSSFFIAYATHSEFFPNGINPCTYIAYRDAFEAEPLGALVLRREKVPSFHRATANLPGLSFTRIDFLATHDNDHPGIAALQGFEEQVTEALLAYLMSEKDWSLLEFRGQENDSVLRKRCLATKSFDLITRDIELLPFERVNIVWDDMRTYFSSLSKRMRSNISRQTRHLFGAGTVEIVLVSGSASCGLFFDAFCDLENRSWKRGTDAAMQRHPKRAAFYRELMSGRAGLDPSIVGVALDGVLIAALINGSGRSQMWSLEMAYDEAYSELGPGQLLLLLSVGEAISRNLQSLRFFQHHEYFKKRWLAEPTPAVNVQVIRRWSTMGARAVLGDLSIQRNVSRRAFD